MERKIDLQPQKLQFLALEVTKAIGTQAPRFKIQDIQFLNLKERVNLTCQSPVDPIRVPTFTLQLLKRTKTKLMSLESPTRLNITITLVQTNTESTIHQQKRGFLQQLLEHSQDQISGKRKSKVQRTNPNVELMRELLHLNPTRRKLTLLELLMKQNTMRTLDLASIQRVTIWPRPGV